jgi:predicted lipoprotein with Yx(FWY)xxD motif
MRAYLHRALTPATAAERRRSIAHGRLSRRSNKPTEEVNVKRLLTCGALAASLALAACGGGGNGSSSSAAPSAAGMTVAVKSIGGLGSVLVDSHGKALYAADQEAGGKVLCTSSACTAFWKPLTTDSARPTASSEAGKVGVVKRPDGNMQVAVAGRPLYTFSEDSPGKVSGDGFKDDFGGQHFTWHAVRAGGKTSSGGATSAGGGQSGGGYGGGSSGSGGGY